jgi:hypothetical protein
MSRLIKITAAILILISSTVSLGQSEIIIPMDLNLNRPVIELFINQNGPYQFIFDTGAGGNIIDQDLVSDLGLKETGKVDIGAPGSETKSSAPQVAVSEIKVSGQSFSNISMVVMPLRKMIPVDGVLSFREFSEYLVNINYPEKKIILIKGELPKDQANIIKLIPDCEILTVPLKANGRMWSAHMDTGSPFSFSFPLALKDQLKFKSPPVPLAGQSRTISGTRKNWTARLDGSIQLADIIYHSPEIILSERHHEYVNIGYQLLKNLSITIDQRNGLIQFHETESRDISGKENRENENTGIVGRYGGVRSITLENGIYYIQRDGSIKMKLVKVSDNLYVGQLPEGLKAMNVLPKIRFERDGSQRVIGLTFIYPDGREEFVKKDDAPR